jgi:hypothetical protein
MNESGLFGHFRLTFNRYFYTFCSNREQRRIMVSRCLKTEKGKFPARYLIRRTGMMLAVLTIGGLALAFGITWLRVDADRRYRKV